MSVNKLDIFTIAAGLVSASVGVFAADADCNGKPNGAGCTTAAGWPGMCNMEPNPAFNRTKPQSPQNYPFKMACVNLPPSQKVVNQPNVPSGAITLPPGAVLQLKNN